MIIKDGKFQFLLTLLIVFFVLYPNPVKLGLSIYRVYNPPIDPETVLAYPIDFTRANLTPADIETLVIENVPYQYDWTTYRMPWYFPTVEEVVENQAGDCKSRMIVLASIFEYLEKPYDLRFSVNHFWVDYPGKVGTGIEREEMTVYSREEGFQLPEIDWDSTLNAYSAFWDYMPSDVKISFSLAILLPALLVRISLENFDKFQKPFLLYFHDLPIGLLFINSPDH